jgi:hypothetical protein
LYFGGVGVCHQKKSASSCSTNNVLSRRHELRNLRNKFLDKRPCVRSLPPVPPTSNHERFIMLGQIKIQKYTQKRLQNSRILLTYHSSGRAKQHSHFYLLSIPLKKQPQPQQMRGMQLVTAT